MILNYIKLALRVMARRKFFTFITLFGISFTLMVLMLIVAYLNTEFGSNPPLSNVEELVIVPTIRLKKEYFDSIPKYDTTMIDGVAHVDTSFDLKSKGQSNSTSELSRRLIDGYFMDLPSAKKVTFVSGGNTFDMFINNQKVSLNVGYVGPDYFDILDYQIIEGRLLDENDNKQSKHNIVITNKLSKSLFGLEKGAVGKSIEFDNKDFQVVGVVASPRSKNRLLEQTVFVSESLYEEGTDNYYFGNCSLIAMGDISLVKQDIRYAATKIPLEDPEQFDQVVVKPMTYKEVFAASTSIDDEPEKAYRIMLYILAGIIGFFTLLPLLNLVNLNVSRIMDRSSEIGVRKAFGATDGNILYQYIFENIIQTLVGGVIGLLLAILAIYYINTSGVLNEMILAISPGFFINSLLVTLFFGLISGIIPAYIISKSQIVTALKSRQL